MFSCPRARDMPAEPLPKRDEFDREIVALIG